MTMPNRLVEHILDEARAGNVQMTTRGRHVSIRFGLDPDRVVRSYTEADEWLVVRRVYRDGHFRWLQTRSQWGWKDGKYQRLNTPTIAKTKSRKNLEKRIRSMMPGSGGGHIEVLPWQENGHYPLPGSFNSASDAY